MSTKVRFTDCCNDIDGVSVTRGRSIRHLTRDFGKTESTQNSLTRMSKRVSKPLLLGLCSSSPVQRDPQDTRPVLVMASAQGRMAAHGRTWQLLVSTLVFAPQLLATQVRQYIYAFVAVAPALGMMSCLVLPDANTKMMNLFLQQVSLEFTDYFIVLQVDRAAWHRAKQLQVPQNIRLLPQPSYAPEVMRFCTCVG